MAYVWLFILIFLAFIEVSTINLVTIWFVVSAIVSLIISFFIDSFIVQFGVFVFLGLILLITTRPLLVKFTKNRNEKTNFDRILDMKGIVIKDIVNNRLGEVKVDGKIWSAWSNQNIKPGSIVKVLEINGSKIKVEEFRED